MKNLKHCLLIVLLLASIHSVVKAQETTRVSSESFGSTLNLGLGLGYYRYTNQNMPVLHVNYEFNVGRNFTLAPFISFYSYSNDYYWGNNKYPYRYYHYQQTVVPIGVKGTYYFDELLQANSRWDFYLGASAGFAIVKTKWENDYYGDRNIYRNSYNSSTPLFLDAHIGTEYHASNHIGIFLDLSTGSSTIGISIH